MIHRWCRSLSDLLVPPTCIACRVPLDHAVDLQICGDCQDCIRGPDSMCRCTGCGAKSKSDQETVTDCPLCRDLNLPFASVTCLGNYESLLRDLVIRMKGSGGQSVALQLGNWLALDLSERSGRFDFITAMPIHWTRQLRRGHHVAGLLCESICCSGLVPGDSESLLIAARKTRKQGTLTTAQRYSNVKNCFEISRQADVRTKSILLIDDVMTSCATALQAAKVLRKAGAGEIHLAIVARGVGRRL